MTREYIIVGLAGAVYVSESGTRDEMLPGIYVNETMGTLVTLTAAVLTFTANAIQNRIGGSLTAPVFSFTAQSIQNRLSGLLSAASLTLTSQTLQLLLAGSLSAATFSWLGKTIQNRLSILLTAATFTFTPRPITKTGLTVILFLALLGVGS